MTEVKNCIPINQKLRHAEYYGMTPTFDMLYANSSKGQNFNRIMKYIVDDNNILLAYRNIKRNKGSVTPGVDGITIKDIEGLSRNEFLEIVNKRFNSYKPRKVKRVDIPKGHTGKTRPLGIPSIWDRIAQQCILQVLEPICEAKFNNHSYGFRPNRSTENALADCLSRINQSHMEFVVDIDIKGFFDEVNHTKLMKQIWSLGIHDKQLLVIIRKMLKAPIVMPNGITKYPTKGTPQGGVLSPLLANINLNELDWWIYNQWEGKEAKELKYHFRENGAWDKGNIYHKLRKSTTLKELYIVRYADDFKIFCKTGNEAHKIFHAVQKWLTERLKLSISEEKSRVTNLNKNESEFLGFSIMINMKGHKKVAYTHVSSNSETTIKQKLKVKIKEIQHSPDGRNRFLAISDYNSMVIGIHNYYRIGTHCSVSFRRIAKQLQLSLNLRLKNRGLSKSGAYGKNEGYKPYFQSNQIRYIEGFPILPIGYIKSRHPMNKRRDVNKYTEEGRLSIHSNQKSVEVWKIQWLIKHAVISKRQSVEFVDNRISKFVSQQGKCGVTKQELILTEMHCHHIIPYNESKDDRYHNLIIVTEDIHKLIHATVAKTINELLFVTSITQKELNKLNMLRKKVGNTSILFNSER